MREELKALAGPDRALRDIISDRGLAALGDALVNFAYSLALSLDAGRPRGKRLDNRALSEALRASGLRPLIPKRMDRHQLANAVEALLAYGWLKGMFNLSDLVEALRGPDAIGGLSGLLKEVVAKAGLKP